MANQVATRPRAVAVRRRACRRSSASSYVDASSIGDRAAGDPGLSGPAGRRPAAVRPQSARLPVARRCSRAVQWFLFGTRAGLVAARGRRVAAIGACDRLPGHRRFATLAVLFGGACAGLGGAYLSVAYTPLWVEGMTAGRGWIALALVVFATWKPWRVLAGAYLFGGVTLAQFQAQALGVDIPSQYLVDAALRRDDRRARRSSAATRRRSA